MTPLDVRLTLNLLTLSAPLTCPRPAGAGQRGVQGRSLPGLRTAQMCLIWSPAMSKANTVTVMPSSCLAAGTPTGSVTKSPEVARAPGSAACMGLRHLTETLPHPWGREPTCPVYPRRFVGESRGLSPFNEYASETAMR